MIFVLLCWIYIFIITQVIGLGFYKCAGRLLKTDINISLTKNTVCGIVVTTVYAQIFSLFYKVGLIANALLIIACIFVAVKFKDIILEYLREMVKNIFSWDGLLYLGIIFVFAFAASRGNIHADTNMYHAQAIRWYEEFGVVKGLGNLQWHFAYNSACFAFAALFSLNFLGFGPLHCTTGFIAAALCIWALGYVKDFSSHKSHMTDMCCVALLFYAVVNFAGFVSPASDYMTMFFALYLIARWAEEIESGRNDISAYALLSVLAVFTVTLKLSAGLVVLLAVYPAAYLIKGKRYKEIAAYLALGVVTVLPFLVRNVIISGWLLYPFPAIDLFNFDWKVPEQYVMIDSAQIKVWARCLYDTNLVDMPIREWFPVWWSSQEHYAQMLVIFNILAVGLDVALLLHLIIKKEKINFNIILLILVNLGCLAAWFVLAPFIRYGLAFLLAFPMLSVGMWLHKKEGGLYKLVSGTLAVLMFFAVSSYCDHYFMDDLVFVKSNLTEPYYIRQKDYDTSEMDEYDMNGITVYSPKEGEVTGYKYFPASAYDFMISVTELRGSSLKDGFRNTEYRQ